MPEVKKFLLYVFMLSLILTAILFYPLTLYKDFIQIKAVLAGYLISLISAVFGFLLNSSALHKSSKSFMVMVFGGMGLRLLLIIILAALLLGIFQLEALSFLGSVLFFYILFMLLEIFLINKSKNRIVNQGY